MSDKYCPHCGEQNVIMFGNRCDPLFTKENRPSIPNGDATNASIIITNRGPDLIPFLCDSCSKWFAIFCVPVKDYNIDDEK